MTIVATGLTATGLSAKAAGSTVTSDATKISTDFQMFLKMLTAQMKNQDPLNPMDSSDYATQLATFSGVEQQVKTNDLLGALQATLSLSGMAQMAAWVGMEARSTAKVAFGGAPVTLYPKPAPDTDRAVLVAYDAQNREVMRIPIPVSTEPLQWTGLNENGAPVPYGAYSLLLESYAGGKLIANDKVEAYSRVTEIRQGANGPELVLASGDTALPSAVSALRPAAGQ
ncbi:MAG: flagellar hook capping FlgD N-terminal domain-containing protein [Paracoccaceae bacterium]